MLLVIGSKGLLGSAVVAYETAHGRKVITASHQAGVDIYLDLNHSPITLNPTFPAGLTHALICSSITNIDACRRRPDETGRFNVVHTIELLKILLHYQIQPIFCSSDLVFKGDKGDYDEEAPRYPTTEYGRQKKEVEDFLLSQNQAFLIVRMSKLYTLDKQDTSPISYMLSELLQERSIQCATDQVICPTAVMDVVKAIDGLCHNKLTGVYHIIAPQRFTRYSLGQLIAQFVGCEHLVQPCSIRDFNFIESRPANNSLNNTKAVSHLGITFTTVEENLPQILNQRHV